DTIPDAGLWKFLRVRKGAMIHTGLDDFNAVHARGVARTTTALRAWWGRYTQLVMQPAAARAALSDAVLERFLRERLRYVEQMEQRRATWLREHGGMQ